MSVDAETGTTSYAYDGNHHLVQRTDAKWRQTKYTYDAYERLIEVQHYAAGTCQYCQGAEQVNQRVLYTYDVNPLDPGNYTNSWGRLTGVNFQQQTGNGDQFGYYYSYNQAGRVTTNTFQATIGGSMLASLAATYVWDNQGRMTNMTYPSGPQLAYQYDSNSNAAYVDIDHFTGRQCEGTADLSAQAAPDVSDIGYSPGCAKRRDLICTVNRRCERLGVATVEGEKIRLGRGSRP
jgi:YD repeat-containing protein